MEKEYITINRKAYDEFAKQHNERINNLSKTELSDEYWKELIFKELLTSDKINKVLEIGPGTGRILRIFSELNCETTAVDLSEEMIKYAKKQSPNTNFIKDNILDIEFPDNTYDAIFMGAVIHNFPTEDAKKLLSLVYKWLNKTGKILIYTTVHETSEEGYSEKKDYKGNIVRYRKKYTKEELKNMIEEFGFKITYELYTTEPDRDKKWMTFIIEKK